MLVVLNNFDDEEGFQYFSLLNTINNKIQKLFNCIGKKYISLIIKNEFFNEGKFFKYKIKDRKGIFLIISQW